MIREKEVTMYDIANRLNISTATVSRALKNAPVVSVKTKKKIFAVSEEMNYRTNHFASNLRNPGSATIGVIVPRLNSATTEATSTIILRSEIILRQSSQKKKTS
ncbi:MAG: LacI family DNA-binding transcriptional regulator [Ginsengibacter sp.]